MGKTYKEDEQIFSDIKVLVDRYFLKLLVRKNLSKEKALATTSANLNVKSKIVYAK
jgi:hypothetical protein